MPKLDKTAVDAAQPRATPYYLWDSRMPGFGLRVTPAGVKTYVAKLWDKAKAKPTWVKLGRHGIDLTAAEAYDKALEARGDVTHGRVPLAKPEAPVALPLVKDLILDFMTKHAASLSPRTIIAYTAHTKIIEAALGDLEVDAVKRPHIEAMWRGVKSQSTANCMLRTCNTMFEKGIEWELRTKANPCTKAPRHHDPQRERTLTDDESLRLGKAIQDRYLKSPIASLAVRFVAMTGLRIGEARDLRWSQVDMGSAVLTFTYTQHKSGKTNGTKTIPINQYALSILGAIPRVDGNPYVFFGHGKLGNLGCGLNKIWNLIRKDAGLNDNLSDDDERIVMHSLRHTFVSQLIAAGEELTVAGQLVGHRSPTSTARYAHLVVKRAREASNRGLASLAKRLTQPET